MSVRTPRPAERSRASRRVTRPFPDVARAFAPASVANFGPGFDLLGAALDGAGDVVTARVRRKAGVEVVSITGDGGRLPYDPAKNTAAVAATVVLEMAKRKGRVPGLELTLEKGLPLASGMGSSAASAVAGALAAAHILGFRDKRRLLRAVLLAENAADGSWHGDNAFSSLLGGLVLVPSSNPRKPLLPVSLPVPERLRLVLIHPKLELTTAASRAALPKTVTLADQVAQSGALAELVAALYRGDLAVLGRCVSSDRIVDPARAPLVAGYAAVKEAAKRSGALGCALAGAGPSVLAISEEGDAPAAIVAATVKAWASEGIEADAKVHRIDPEGARLL